MMVKKNTYEVVHMTRISVSNIERQPQEVFTEDETREMKNLVKQGYIVIVKGDV